MEKFKVLLTLLLSLILAFGIWYIMFWFLLNESNMFMWSTFSKVIYLILSFLSASGIAENLDNK
jgi:zinc transporter ZupT